MQTSAEKEDQPDSARPPRNWRHRKQENARRRHEKQRRRELVDGWVQKLGGIERVDALVRVEIGRIVDMTLLAEGMRGRALRGEMVDIGNMIRLEGAISRIIRALVPPPGAAPGDDAWRKFLASQHAATNEGDG
jgi:hypothetical protein